MSPLPLLFGFLFCGGTDFLKLRPVKLGPMASVLTLGSVLLATAGIAVVVLSPPLEGGTFTCVRSRKRKHYSSRKVAEDNNNNNNAIKHLNIIGDTKSIKFIFSFDHKTFNGWIELNCVNMNKEWVEMFALTTGKPNLIHWQPETFYLQVQFSISH